MKFILSVHFRNSFYEIFLPGVNNRRIEVVVPAAISRIDGETSLALEVWNGQWSVLENSAVELSRDGVRQQSCKLEKNLTISCIHKHSHEKFALIVNEHYGGYSNFNKYQLKKGQITIGSADSNTICYNTKKLVSAHHAVLETDEDGVCWIKDASSNGTFVNGEKITGARKLNFGDVVYILGLKLVCLGTVLAVNQPSDQMRLTALVPFKEEADKTRLPEKLEEEYYLRSPRRIEPLDDETIEIEGPPNPNRNRRQPLIFTIGPSMTMVIPMAAGVMFTVWSAQNTSGGVTSPFVFMGIITSVTAAFIGVFWALTNYQYSKKTEKKEEARRCQLYQNYLEKMRCLLAEKHQSNKAVLDKAYPETSECLRFVRVKSRRLWERNVNHQDFLTIRIGQGDIPAINEITVPKERFSLIDDSLGDEPRNIQREFAKLKNVPIRISLQKHNLIGVIGASGDVFSIAQVMATQLASYHSYTDVKMVFLYNEKDTGYFAFAKWYPHTWSEDGEHRLIACDANGVGEVFFYLSAVIRGRLEAAEESGAKEKRPLPHYVVFIADPSLVENEAVMKYLSGSSEQIGFSTVLLYQQIGRLPNHCTVVMQCDEDYQGYYSLDNAFAGFDHVVFDQLNQEALEEFARELSDVQIREVQTAGAIPRMLSFLDMYKTSKVENIDVERHWLENRTYESMRAMVGYSGADTPLYLDIHEKYHGPHGLVAGTTGSGKSETLQTYILSLALNYHPHEISFILIDYKGGGMAGSFEGLPHIAGIITNLGGNQTNRALASINSEIKRRQAMFNEHKLKHIDGYIELYRAGKADVPMPHLLIIADEFAELKKEQPDFVRELVSASRVGRSLGVHLILATQKPSGVVDEEIWSNAKFRLCLRVQDKQDSNEMIRRPDAAYITNAGRGYFQVGSGEIFEQFQSGFSGAGYEPEVEYSNAGQGDARLINLWGKPLVVGSGKKRKDMEDKEARITQLEAVVQHIAKVARRINVKPLENIWLPPLTQKLELSDLTEYQNVVWSDGTWKGKAGELRPYVGIVDDPVNQQQAPVFVDLFTEGHVLVTGSSTGGKTTFLQTLLYSLVTTYSPDQLQLYIADFGSRTMGVFSTLPHVGGVLFESDTDKADKLIALLLKELARRTAMFAEKGISSIKEYVKLYDDVPFIVFAIDNFAAWNENCFKQEDNLIKLLQAAASYGIYLVFTCSGPGDMRARMKQHINYGVGLQLNDRFEYEEAIGTRPGIVAEDHIPGRGLVCFPEPLEFQTALCMIDDDGKRSVRLRLQFQQMAESWNGGEAPAIPQVPEDMALDSLLRQPEFATLAASSRYLPFGYDIKEASVEAIDLAKTFCYSISGTPRSGKTNMLKSLMRLVRQSGGQVYLFDSEIKELEAYGQKLGLDGYLTTSDQLFDLMKEVIIPELSRRNARKAEFIQGGRKDVDGYIASQQKMFLFINDMTAFVKAVYESERDMKGFMEQMVTRGDEHLIYLFACVSANDMTGEYNAKRFLRSFIAWKQGVHLGGRLEDQRIFDFEVPMMERGKRQKSGYGHVISEGVTKQVVTVMEE